MTNQCFKPFREKIIFTLTLLTSKNTYGTYNL